jgi:phosphoglycolate phosphatase
MSSNWNVPAIATSLGAIEVLYGMVQKLMQARSVDSDEVESDTPEEKRVIKGALFDMDGTLLESKEIWYDLLRAACVKFGYPELTYEDWASTYGQSMAMNVVRFMPGLDQALLDQYCYDSYAEHLEKMFILEGAEDSLELANVLTGNRTCLVTNCPWPITKLLLEAPKSQRIRELLTSEDGSLRVVCADDMVDGAKLASKPDPAMLHLAAQRVGLQARDCIMVGDSKFDVLAAENAGCAAVGIVAHAEVTLGGIAELAQVQNVFAFEQ